MARIRFDKILWYATLPCQLCLLWGFWLVPDLWRSLKEKVFPIPRPVHPPAPPYGYRRRPVAVTPSRRPPAVPKPLRPRKRALTHPLSPPDLIYDPSGKSTKSKNFKQATCHQTKHEIFRLPQELRLMIWSQALGEHIIHIGKVSGFTLAYRICEHGVANLKVSRERPEECCGCGHVGEELPTVDSRWRESAPTRAHYLLSLPLTCRQVYSETIDLLYKNNVFDFWSANLFLFFSERILAKRFQSIARLRINYSDLMPLPFDSISLQKETRHYTAKEIAEWRGPGLTIGKEHSIVWQIISSMKCLQEIYVNIEEVEHCRSNLTIEYGGLLTGYPPTQLAPLYWPRQAKTFMLFLRNHASSRYYAEYKMDVYEPHDAPFTVHVYETSRCSDY